MVHRRFWVDLIERSWRKNSVLWLSGVRRAGKTCLCRGLRDVEYLDCELPRVRRMMDDPQGFLDGLRKRRLVLDEVHRLDHPSQLLKIAADHYPDIRVLATGSSTLAATAKFRDALTGRKRDLWLTPMCEADCDDFDRGDLPRRLLHGGLPPFFLADALPEREFQEWLDGYWAKDIQSLFRLERRSAFQKLVELLLAHSGGIFEATTYATPCEISRATVSNYLHVLEATFVVNVIRPFSTHRPTEIVSAPRVYGFDTGFVCHFRGWSQLRDDDLGVLWEHYVLNEIMARCQTRRVFYWRDKRGHEIDLVWAPPGQPPTAIECKWSADRFDPSGLTAFRGLHPDGVNLVVAHDVDAAYTRHCAGLPVRFVSLASLVNTLSA